MNKDIEKIIQKNKYRSNFYQHKKTKKPIVKKPIQNKESTTQNKFLISLMNKIMISICVLFVLLISKKDERLELIYKTTFKNMNIVQIDYFIKDKFSGIFPLPENEYKYVDAPVIDYTNTENYKEGVKVTLTIGAPVQSSIDGRVIRIYHDDDLGKVVVIQDAQGYEYYYGYLEDVNVKPFEAIQIGKTIGLGYTDDDLNTYFYLAIHDEEDDLVDVLSTLGDYSLDGAVAG